MFHVEHQWKSAASAHGCSATASPGTLHNRGSSILLRLRSHHLPRCSTWNISRWSAGARLPTAFLRQGPRPARRRYVRHRASRTLPPCRWGICSLVHIDHCVAYVSPCSPMTATGGPRCHVRVAPSAPGASRQRFTWPHSGEHKPYHGGIWTAVGVRNRTSSTLRPPGHPEATGSHGPIG